jgi:hypothetical protein
MNTTVSVPPIAAATVHGERMYTVVLVGVVAG